MTSTESSLLKVLIMLTFLFKFYTQMTGISGIISVYFLFIQTVKTKRKVKEDFRYLKLCHYKPSFIVSFFRAFLFKI